MDKRKLNASGCKDMTPFLAIENINREEKEDRDEARFKRLLATIFYLCDLAGFNIENRIEIRDKRTGKVWK